MKLSIIIVFIISMLSINSISGQLIRRTIQELSIEDAVSRVAKIKSNFDEWEIVNKNQHQISFEYCRLLSEQPEVAHDFYNVQLSNYTTHLQKCYFYANSFYCLNQSQRREAVEYLDLYLETEDFCYLELVSHYGLASKIDGSKLTSMDTLFNEISTDLKRNKITPENIKELTNYALMANLNQVDENVYINFVLDLYYQYADDFPTVINDFYNKILQHSLAHLTSKNSILKSLVFLTNPHKSYIVGDEICFSLSEQYFYGCIVPKIFVDEYGRKLVSYYEDDLNVKSVINEIETGKVMWKSEIIIND